MIKGFFSDSELSERAEDISESFQKNVSYSHTPNIYKKRKPMFKRIITYIAKTFAGENRVGEALHGIFDLIPFPNQVIAKIFSYITAGEGEKATEEFKKLISFRNIVAVVAFIAIITGLLDFEQVQRLLEMIL